MEIPICSTGPLSPTNNTIRSEHQAESNSVFLYDQFDRMIEQSGPNNHIYTIDGVHVNLPDKVVIVGRALISDMIKSAIPKYPFEIGGSIPPQYIGSVKLPLYHQFCFSYYPEFPGCMIYVDFQSKKQGLLRTVAYLVALTKTRVIVIRCPGKSFTDIRTRIQQIIDDDEQIQSTVDVFNCLRGL